MIPYYKFLAVFVSIYYVQFCLCKPLVHKHPVIASNKKIKKRTRIIKNRKMIVETMKTKNNDSFAEKKKENDDDTFFSHLNKLDIPEKFKLKEIVVGNSNVPKSLIIYFSYTCPHCREFYINEFPKFKREYIDTGKIKVVFRNYIDDQGAYEAAQIVRCICNDSVDAYENLSELVLQKQKEWLYSDDPANFLIKIFTDGNIDEKEARACLKRTDIGAGLMLEQKRAMNNLQLISMPSFINDKGEKHEGAITCEELAQFCEIR